ncbi:hypothetical protein IAQ61_002411 [Plenodomus lingam]|uniref:uncharacterized protein n=1 Tax=Leptosphaeria maculans TaxID=5022 RepID=UPI0033345ED6|nr:hypothetical protein IAQ61_002411 [Plenodomus lingam]
MTRTMVVTVRFCTFLINVDDEWDANPWLPEQVSLDPRPPLKRTYPTRIRLLPKRSFRPAKAEL